MLEGRSRTSSSSWYHAPVCLRSSFIYIYFVLYVPGSIAKMSALLHTCNGSCLAKLCYSTLFKAVVVVVCHM